MEMYIVAKMGARQNLKQNEWPSYLELHCLQIRGALEKFFAQSFISVTF